VCAYAKSPSSLFALMNDRPNIPARSVGREEDSRREAEFPFVAKLPRPSPVHSVSLTTKYVRDEIRDAWNST